MLHTADLLLLHCDLSKLPIRLLGSPPVGYDLCVWELTPLQRLSAVCTRPLDSQLAADMSVPA